MHRVRSNCQPDTLTSREVSWNRSWSGFSHPLLGIGPMQFAALRSQVGAHPHNWPIQIAAEWGFPATVILLVLIIAVGRRIARCPNACRSCWMLRNLGRALCSPGRRQLGDARQSDRVRTCGRGCLCGLTRDNGPKQNQPGLGIAMAIDGFTLCNRPGRFRDRIPIRSVRQYRIEFQRAYPDAWLLPRFWAHGFL